MTINCLESTELDILLKEARRQAAGLQISSARKRASLPDITLLSHRVVDEIVIDTPDIHIVRNSDGSFNFSDLLRKEKPETPRQKKRLTLPSPFPGSVSTTAGWFAKTGRKFPVPHSSIRCKI
jgi:uncharacterized protein involved in outer membrane biogenesis